MESMGGPRRPARVPAENGAQIFIQTAVCAKETQAHSHARNAKAFGDFLRAVLQDVAQEANLAEFGGKLSDGAREKRAHFAARVTFLRVRTAGRQVPGDVLRRIRITVFKRDVSGIVSLPKQINGRVRGDAGDPSVQIAMVFVFLAGKLIETRESLQ